MKKLMLLLLSYLFVSCIKDSKKEENTSLTKEQIVLLQKEYKLLNLNILIELLSKDHSQLKKWALDNSYKLEDDVFTTDVNAGYFGGNKLTVKNNLNEIIFSLDSKRGKCTGLIVNFIKKENYKYLLDKARNNFSESDCKTLFYLGGMYMEISEDEGEIFNCFSNGKVDMMFNDKSSVNNELKIKKENYFSLNMKKAF